MPMYKVTDKLEKDAKKIGQKNKMERGNLLAQVKQIEEEALDEDALASRKERQLEWQKKNEYYNRGFMNGKNELGSTWYLEELKHNMRQKKNALQQRKVLNKIELLDNELSEVREGRKSIGELLAPENIPKKEDGSFRIN